METRRFDALARELSTGTTRRQAAQVLGAGAVGAALTRLGFGAAAAKKKRNKQKRKKKQLGQTCKKGKECQGALGCQLTQADPDHCGTDAAAKRCCVPQGGRCDYGCECCGSDVICNGHVCQSA
jgi:hypothetical protein